MENSKRRRSASTTPGSTIYVLIHNTHISTPPIPASASSLKSLAMAQPTTDDFGIECKLAPPPRHRRTYVVAALALALVSALGGAGVAVAVLTADDAHRCDAARIAAAEPEKSPPPPAPPQQNAASGPPSSPYDVDPTNKRRYRNGERRRPTDPATAQEVVAAQTLLFGSAPLTTLDAADALWRQPGGWAAAAAVLATAGGIDPASIVGVSKVGAEAGDPSGAEARLAVLDKAKAVGFPAAHAWVQEEAQRPVRRALQWWKVHQIASAVPEREHVVAVEEAIEAGKADYPMVRLLHVRLAGGARAFTDEGAKVGRGPWARSPGSAALPWLGCSRVRAHVGTAVWIGGARGGGCE